MRNFCPSRAFFRLILPMMALLAIPGVRQACAETPREIVRQVVKNEIWADDHDHTRWMYRDSYKSPAKDVVKLVIQTPQGDLSQIILDHGHPPSDQVRQQDLTNMQRMINDPSYRARQKRNAQHDDQQARDLMNMLPNAFIWKVDSIENGEIHLSYKPDPNFSAPSMSARVMSSMSGTMVVDEKQKRLKALNGRLMQPVTFGWGLFGRLDAGGTFQIIRTELAPGIWDITQTHVHISGHALFFKNIGDQEDEVSSDYHRVPEGVDIAKAGRMLQNGEVARQLEAELHVEQ